MKGCFDHVIAEPECLYFELFQDPNDPGTISWVENWNKSPEKFMAVCSPVYQINLVLNMSYANLEKENMGKDYYKPYLAATEPMFTKPREFKILKRVGLPYVYHKPENFV